MKFQVKEVNPVEEKSTQEVEKDLLEKHEKSLEDKTKDSDTINQDEGIQENPTIEEDQGVKIKDEDVLSYIKENYKKDFSSIDELFVEKKVDNDLPEDVSKYLKFKQETGRGIKDFVKANQDYDNVSDDQILAEYYSLTESDLDKEDISYLIESKFSYDEELDEDSEIKKKNIAKKRELSKARKYLNEFKEKYSAPLESSGNANFSKAQEELDALKKSIQDSNEAKNSLAEKAKKKNEYFRNKTNELFDNEFKGFEFTIGDKKINYSYGDAQEMKSKQMDLGNFINKYVGEDGLISDAKGWHRALSAAMNPEKFAQYFYEQGKADGVGDLSRKSKNINMEVRNTPQAIGSTGFRAREMDSNSGSRLRIRSNKNKK